MIRNFSKNSFIRSKVPAMRGLFAVRPASVALMVALTVPYCAKAVAAGDFLQEKAYKSCLASAGHDPEAAFGHASSWFDMGGGPPAKHCMGVALLQMGKPKDAAEIFEDLAKHLPDDTPKLVAAEVLAHAGIAWMEADDPDKAYAAQTAALKLAPGNPDILTDRAMTLESRGHLWEAIDDLNAAHEAKPGDAMILIYRASAYRQLEVYDLALEDANQALKLHPDEPEGLLERGIIYRMQGKKEEARKDWLRLIELHDGRPAAEDAKRNLELLDMKE